MITKADADRLRALHSAKSGVLSVYLPVPLDLADHRALSIMARDLVKSAAQQVGNTSRAPEADLRAIMRAVGLLSHDWLGHTIASFACAELGLLETAPLPGHFERAVLSPRPYTRPLYAALQRNPAYHAAVIDSRHAWILAIDGERIETVAERTGTGVPSPAFSGWYGLEAYRIQQRMIRLARQHFKDTIDILAHTGDGERRPLVIGGHQDEVKQFLAVLPRQVRQAVAGTFHVDLRTVTPARVRELAGPVIARWLRTSEARLVDEILDEPPGSAVVTDLNRCLTAARFHAVAHLFVRDDLMIPGSACDDCGEMAAGEVGCDCGDQACRMVPDLLDELASRVLDDSGQVTSVHGAPFPAAARLRFAVNAKIA